MDGSQQISYLVAFLSGSLLFFSPCILPLIPTYISYLTGVSFSQLTGDSSSEEKRKIRKRTMIHSLMFIIGFSIIFILLGTTVTYLSRYFLKYLHVLRMIGAVVIIFFGFMITGVLNIGFLVKEKRIEYRKRGISYLGSVLVGATFAFAWTPCVGPILGSILVYASSTANVKLGVTLLCLFSLGLAVPFFLSSLLVNSFLSFFTRFKKYIRVINVIGGIILIGFGVLILTGGIR